MVKSAFPYTPAIVNALETSLSPERMATYAAAAASDKEKALRLYTWNTAISAAFYGPLQGLEVALRNSMHQELSAKFGALWFDDPRCGLDAGALQRLRSVKDDVRRAGHTIDAPHIVAAMPFGFWVSLLGRGGRTAAGTGYADYERTLWRPCLYAAFPNRRAGRRQVHAPLDFLRTFRNRIAHHEPIFGRHLEKDHESILVATSWISVETKTWIEHHSRVPQLLASSRDGLDFF
ncbi:hypothetical protein [Methylobacterium brachiatum]